MPLIRWWINMHIITRNLFQKLLDAWEALYLNEWEFNENLFPEPTDQDIWEYHTDNAFDYIRESTAYDSNGALVAADTPVYEEVV